MADRWPDLVRGFDRLTVTADLREQVEQRRSRDGASTHPPRNRRPQRLGLAIAGLCVAAAVGVVLIIAAHSRKDASVPGNGVEIVNPRDTHVTTSIIGGSPGLRQAIHDSLAGIGHSTIKTVTVVQAAKRAQAHAPHGVVLNFSYPKSPRAQVAYASWQAGLVAAATRDRAIARGLDRSSIQARDVRVRLVEARSLEKREQSDRGRVDRTRTSRSTQTRRHEQAHHHPQAIRPRRRSLSGHTKHGRLHLQAQGRVRTRRVPQRILSDSGATEIDGSYFELQYNGQPLAADYLDTRAHTSSRWDRPPLPRLPRRSPARSDRSTARPRGQIHPVPADLQTMNWTPTRPGGR